MNPIKPEYIFNPMQALKRLVRQKYIPFKAKVRLPWGGWINISPREAIGNCIWRQGIYDLGLTEIIFRIVDQGATVLDIGANIGYITNLMAFRVGESGRVVGFEPHPEIFKKLKKNVDLIRANRKRSGEIKIFQAGLSDKEGIGTLDEGEYFNLNQGLSKIVASGAAGKEHMKSVKLLKLDESFTFIDKIDLIKIDVEGHELNVFKGARSFFEQKKITSIIFEENLPRKSKAIEFLRDYGFNIFHISEDFWGPKLSAYDGEINFPLSKTKNFLATLKSENRNNDFMCKRGWRCLCT